MLQNILSVRGRPETCSDSGALCAGKQEAASEASQSPALEEALHREFQADMLGGVCCVNPPRPPRSCCVTSLEPESKGQMFK